MRVADGGERMSFILIAADAIVWLHALTNAIA